MSQMRLFTLILIYVLNTANVRVGGVFLVYKYNSFEFKPEQQKEKSNGKL